MRVFPRCRITGPRLPLVKSYSFFILMSFGRRREPRRDEAHVLATIGVHNDDESAYDIEADRNEPSFFLGRVVG
jgi:hypothetical protein